MKKTGLIVFLILLIVAALPGYDGFVDIVNETGFSVYYIYVSHIENESWGDDMLGDKELPAGETFRVYLAGHPSSIFDILVEDEEEDTYSFLSVDVEDGPVVVTLEDLDPPDITYSGEATVNGPGGDFDGYVDITNATGFSIYYLQLRTSGETWGTDLLGDEILLDGQIFRVNLNNFPSAIFDFRLEDDEEDTYTFYDVNVENEDVVVTVDHMN